MSYCHFNKLISILLIILSGTPLAENNKIDTTQIPKILEEAIEKETPITTLLSDRQANEIAAIRISFGYTPLSYAALYGNTAAIKELIDIGMNVDELDDNKFTPLFVASRKAKIDAVRLLLEFGANPDALCSDHQHTPLFESLIWDNQDIASLLIKKSTNLNIQGRSGLTALHIASARNLQGATEELLEKKADTSIKDNDGKLPIDYAIENDHREIIRIFHRFEKRSKEDKDKKEEDSSTALAKLRINELRDQIVFARDNKIQKLLDDLVIQYAQELQKITERSYSYKHDATPRDGKDNHQLNCQSKASMFYVNLAHLGLETQAVISPGHIVTVYELSNHSLLVFDEVIKQVQEYSTKEFRGSRIIYADFMPGNRWGIIGEPETTIMASQLQMMALDLKRQGKYKMASIVFEKAIDLLPDYPDLYTNYALTLRFSDKAEKAEKFEIEGNLIRSQIDESLKDIK